MGDFRNTKRFLFLCTLFLSVFSGCENGRQEIEVNSFAELDASGPIAFSDDGEIVATVSSGSYGDDRSSIVEIRDAQTTYPTGTMIRTSSGVREIEFVTNDFGFLLACSSRYPSASEENSERPVSSLEQLCLNGERKVIVARIDDVISSMAISSDHQMVTVCTRPRAYAAEDAHCYVFSLSDGQEIARFSPEKVKLMMGVFVGDANNIFLWAGKTGHRAVGYLVEARSGQLLQQCDVSELEIEANSIVARATSDDVFVSTAGSVYRVNAGMKGITAQTFYTEGFRGRAWGLNSQWLAIDAKATLLAIGEEHYGESKGKGTQVIDIASGRRLKPILKMAGPMEFSPDGKWLYFARQRIQVGDLR